MHECQQKIRTLYGQNFQTQNEVKEEIASLLMDDRFICRAENREVWLS